MVMSRVIGKLVATQAIPSVVVLPPVISLPEVHQRLWYWPTVSRQYRALDHDVRPWHAGSEERGPQWRGWLEVRSLGLRWGAGAACTAGGCRPDLGYLGLDTQDRGEHQGGRYG